MNLKKDPIPKLFLKFLIPSITSALVMALYGVADGIFVGQGVGSMALGAINVGYPVMNLIIAISLGLGTGGATLLSINSENSQYKNKCFSYIINSGVIFYFFTLIVTRILGDKLYYFLGATDNLLPYVRDYMNICTYFSIFFIASIILSAVVRNDSSPNYAMKAMLIGAGANIILDYIFIFPLQMGIKGAAYATGLGQVLSAFYLIKYFFKNRNLSYIKTSFDFKLLKDISSLGFPSFTLEFAIAFITILFNKQIFLYLGEMGVSAYSIVAYVFYIFRMIFNGLAQAIQPIISYNFGFKEDNRIKKVFILGHLVSLGLSLIILFGVKFEGRFIVNAFNNNVELINLANRGLFLYSSAMIFLGANFINISYLQSKNRARAANIISLNRSMIFVAGALYILPQEIGVDGVWLALPCSDLLTFLTSIFFKRKKTTLQKAL
ncbi:MATE family efflux transporter [Cetobacterium sp. SF1]|uniref:MATE family efflux transporter n=1 Tax=unclassified Cetobacterium TaxID=2630983 RepID=UPI003CFB3CB6